MSKVCTSYFVSRTNVLPAATVSDFSLNWLEHCLVLGKQS